MGEPFANYFKAIDESAWYITDFWKANELLVCKQCPQPKIMKKFQIVNHKGIWYATNINLNMGYYKIWLYEDHKKCIQYCHGASTATTSPHGNILIPRHFSRKNVWSNTAPRVSTGVSRQNPSANLGWPYWPLHMSWKMSRWQRSR